MPSYFGVVEIHALSVEYFPTFEAFTVCKFIDIDHSGLIVPFTALRLGAIRAIYACVDLLSNQQNFDLDKSRQKSHHSLKENYSEVSLRNVVAFYNISQRNFGILLIF